MANVKISELAAYPAIANPSTDLLEIVDSTTPATLLNKKVTAQTLSYGGSKVTLVAGANVTITANDTNQTITISATGGGGGGGSFSTVSSRWTNANSTSKNAQTAPGVIDNDGITITLTASSNPGTLTAWTITLNGTALANTYTTTGTFPNYTVAIPVADITGNAIQTAGTVTVALANSMFNLSANSLTNIAPIPFTTALTGSYSPSNRAFYTTTATINYSYANAGAITAFNGVITPAGGTAQNASAASGSFANQPVNGATISGSATGTGQNGAGTATITLTGSVSASTSYTPLWLIQTANSSTPTFATTDATLPPNPLTNTSYQTSGAAQGQTITYPLGTASTQYNWICTQRPLGNILFVSPFGNAPFVPDLGGTTGAITQTIAGQTFNIYGVTGLSTNNALQLVIT